MPCLSLPHVNTLEKLYSSFGLESEFLPFLKQAIHSFSEAEKHLIIQMDEIHVKSDNHTKEARYIVLVLVQKIQLKLYLLLWCQVFRKNGLV